jgi:M6 family metalloprotease-like protein
MRFRVGTTGAVLGLVIVGQLLLAPASPAHAAAPSACRLPPPADVPSEHEGRTDYNRWRQPTGTIRAIVLFTDFNDVQGTPSDLTSLRAVMEPAVGWFKAASYDRFTYQLDFTSSWHRINADSSVYADNTRSGAAHLEYIQAAVSAADPVVDFSRYDFIYVMVPSALHTSAWRSGAFIAPPGFAAINTREGVKRHAATFGEGTEFYGSNIVNHETGHLFGLPDLYVYGAPFPQTYDPIGGWDLMGFAKGPAPDYLAWEKWKLGWLTDGQVACVNTPGTSTTRTLTPLSTATGLKTVVVRTSSTSAVVVENRQVSALDGGSCFRPGVLVYQVDASVFGGNRPIRILDGHPNTDTGESCTVEHRTLGDATLSAAREQVSDTTGRVRVRVVSFSGGNARVTVSYT